MKTLVISSEGAAVPDKILDVIARGSTSFEQRRAADLPPAAALPAADRVVFWAAGKDPGLKTLAARYAQAERAERREMIVFITTSAAEAVRGLSSTEVFVWPQDEDRLTMAFMTGA